MQHKNIEGDYYFTCFGCGFDTTIYASSPQAASKEALQQHKKNFTSTTLLCRADSCKMACPNGMVISLKNSLL